MFDILQTQCDTFATHIYFDDADADVLMFVTIPGEFHSYDEVGEGMDILVEFEDFNLSTRIATRLLKLGEDVAEGGP